MHTLVLPAAAGPSGEVSAALKLAGGSQSGLETALREVDGKGTYGFFPHTQSGRCEKAISKSKSRD